MVVEVVGMVVVVVEEEVAVVVGMELVEVGMVVEVEEEEVVGEAHKGVGEEDMGVVEVEEAHMVPVEEVPYNLVQLEPVMEAEQALVA